MLVFWTLSTSRTLGLKREGEACLVVGGRVEGLPCLAEVEYWARGRLLRELPGGKGGICVRFK